MMFLGTYGIDEYVAIPAVTHRFSSGAAYAPTAITYSIYEEGSATGLDENIDMVPASPFDAVTGFYYARRQLTAAAGFEANKTYVVLVKATVDSVSAIDAHVFQVRPLQTGDSYAVVSNGTYGNSALNTDIDAIKAKTDNLPAVPASTTNITAGTITTVTNLTNAPTDMALNSTVAKEATLTNIKGATFDTATDSLEALRNRGDAAWVTATGFSTLDAPGVRTAVGLAAANLDTQLDAIPTVGEFTARSLPSADYVIKTDTIAGVTLCATCTTNTDMRGTNGANTTVPPTVDAIADQVWDEILSGHAGVGSAGAALSAAGGSGDPWSTALPGAYGAGTAGKIIGDNINTTISSRSAPGTAQTITPPSDMALNSTVAKDATVSKPGTAQTITPPADMALNSTVAKAATALSNVTWTTVKAGYIDATVSSRSAPGTAQTITPPSDMALNSTVAKDATVSKPGTAQTITPPSDMALNSTVAKSATALSNVTWTAVKAGYIDTTVSSRSSHSAADVKTSLESAGSSIANILEDTGTTIPASITALPTDADVNAACDTAISDAALATAANLAIVDTVVDAIKAKTDSLTFTAAGKVDANMKAINDHNVAGIGAAGDLWRPE
jgi:hypothetical protein